MGKKNPAIRYFYPTLNYFGLFPLQLSLPITEFKLDLVN